MSSPCTLTGGAFQDSEGNVLALGYLTFRLSQDASVNTSNICSGVEIRIALDSSANAVGGSSIWGNDVLAPVNTYYRVTGYTAKGQPAWGPNNQQVAGSTFDLGTWIPNQVISWVSPTGPTAQSTTFEASGSVLSSDSTVNFEGDGTYISVSNPSAGNVKSVLSIAAVQSALASDFDALGAAAAALAAAESSATAAVATETSRAEAAEALLAPKASPTFTGTVSGITAAMVGADASGAATTAQANAETFATGSVATETSRAEAAEALLAPKASPTFTGNLTVGLSSYTAAITNSPTETLAGSYQSATSTYAEDSWASQVVIGTGTNGTSTLTLTHSGTSGQKFISIPSATIIDWASDGDSTMTSENGCIGFVNGTPYVSGGFGSNISFAFGQASSVYGFWANNVFVQGSTSVVGWTSGSLSTAMSQTNDTSISRSAAGVIAIGTGAQGSTAGTLAFTEALMTASSGAPTSAGTAGSAGQVIYFGGNLYFCSVTGAAGSATWNKLNLTAV